MSTPTPTAAEQVGDPVVNEFMKIIQWDIPPLDLQKMPLLAHYTTLQVLEDIMRNDEVWFSHPSFMNDHQEIVGGIVEGTNYILRHQRLANTLAGGYQAFVQGFVKARDHYGNVHLPDTYIFSLSAHLPADYDGVLSMWRAYGANGNGAAIVINPAKLAMTDGSPLIFEKVEYRSPQGRLQWLEELVQRIIAYVAGRTQTLDQWAMIGWETFDRLKLAAIFSKHKGFEEEQEWRIVYMPERDRKGALKDKLSYFNGPRGLEPKLKYKLEKLTGVSDEEPRLVDLTDRIILGPSRASPLLLATAERMLETAGKAQLKGRVHTSTIPFRSVI